MTGYTRAQAEQENARWLKAKTDAARSGGVRIADTDDPGPVPRERPEQRKTFPNDEVLRLEECLQASWRQLVKQVRDTADRDASLALGRFRIDLEAFLNR